MSKEVKKTIDSMLDRLETVTNETKELKKGLIALQKIHDQQVNLVKQKSKTTPKNVASQRTVPKELAKLLKIKGKLSKIDVTHKLYGYIDENKLKDLENKKNINPNSALKKALGIKKNELLTYDNLQTFIDRVYGDSRPTSEESSDFSDEEQMLEDDSDEEP